MRRDGGFVVMGGGCLLAALLAVAGLAVLGTVLWMRAREEGTREAAEQSEEPVSPWTETDAVLGDRGARRGEDVRPGMARYGVAEAKEERIRLEAEERKLRAEAESRKRELSQLRAETAAAERRLERLRAEARADSSDEETKDLLYGTWVKLEGGEGREGLRARSVRAEAELAEATDRADGIRRKLQELDSGIARAESEARRVGGVAGYGAAQEASRRGMGAVRSVTGVAGSTESGAIDASAAAAGARLRRDAVLQGLMEERR
ncbi:MAG: hypothetical protein IKQ15_11905 [Kiritimatiellae bacterium]|nr:hypothetical protein [Kiritimatiellia bacterium]